MDRAVFDSNVMVSAALSPGACSELLAMVERKAFSLYLSEEILAEVAETLVEPEIGMSPGMIRNYLRKVRKIARIIDKPRTVRVVACDADDDMVIGCALAAKADYIVTGDHHLLDLGVYRHVKIVRVREFAGIVRDNLLSL